MENGFEKPKKFIDFIEKKHINGNYYNINVKITIDDNIIFDRVESISIKNSIEESSDTATVTIPRRFLQKFDKKQDISEENLLEFIKIGQKITIEAGYNGELNTEFEGYISEILDDAPTEIKCIDEMYKLQKAEKLNKLFSKGDLREILQFFAPNYKLELPKEYNIGKVAFENVTPYEALRQLRTDYMIRTYFKNGVLHAGFPINLTGYKSHVFNWNRNVRKCDKFKIIKKENSYYLKMTTKEVGTRREISVEFGKKGENNKEINYKVGLTKEELKTIAKDIYEGIKNTKCEGDFKTWGIPQTRAGDSAYINDPSFPKGNHNGKFLIESVQIDINSSDGFQRTNKIGVSL